MYESAPVGLPFGPPQKPAVYVGPGDVFPTWAGWWGLATPRIMPLNSSIAQESTFLGVQRP